MHLFQRKKEGNKRIFYFLGKQIFSYTKRKSNPRLKAPYNLKQYKINDQNSCIVLVNGPSLQDVFNNEMTLNFIKEKPKICVNAFPNSKEFTQLKPEYFVLADPAFWSKTQDERLSTLFKEMYENLVKVDWQLTIFMGIAAKEWHHFIDLTDKNPHIHFQYINLNNTKRKQIEDNFPYYENNLEMPIPQNVGILALFLAINMEYKEIFLFGANHDWHLNLLVKEDNKLYIKDMHFYEETPNYIPFLKDYKLEKTFTVKEIFEILYKLHFSYEEIAAYASYRDIKIYNASTPSFIDVFERIDLSQ